MATQVILRTITLGTVDERSTPAVSYSVDWAPLLLQAAVALLVLAGFAIASGILTVRGARGSTLRESAR